MSSYSPLLFRQYENIINGNLVISKTLVPGGILEPVSGKSFLFFGNSNKTSDFMADGLLLWWEERKHDLSSVKQLVINIDNGPECSGHRSQFLSRLAEYADSTGLIIT